MSWKDVLGNGSIMFAYDSINVCFSAMDSGSYLRDIRNSYGFLVCYMIFLC